MFSGSSKCVFNVYCLFNNTQTLLFKFIIEFRCYLNSRRITMKSFQICESYFCTCEESGVVFGNYLNFKSSLADELKNVSRTLFFLLNVFVYLSCSVHEHAYIESLSQITFKNLILFVIIIKYKLSETYSNVRLLLLISPYFFDSGKRPKDVFHTFVSHQLQ